MIDAVMRPFCDMDGCLVSRYSIQSFSFVTESTQRAFSYIVLVECRPTFLTCMRAPK